MIYRLISLLLLPLWVVHAWRHGSSRQQADYLRLRLTLGLPRTGRELLWFHAASVGEVEAISPLVRHYLDQGRPLLFTSFTASGLATIRKNFAEQLTSCVLPIDFAPLCQRFFNHFRIRQAIVMETELWPELLQQAANRKIPMVLVNGRLSAKSRGNRMVRALLGKAVKQLQFILCRNEQDRLHFLELGAGPERIEVIGNLKAVNHQSRDYPPIVEQSYLLLASSHEPEESDFLKLKPGSESLPLLVIVPRHPERGESLQTMMQSMQISHAMRSKKQVPSADTEVYLADTLGELQAFMQHATLVIMGGSFEGTGGHNLYEPARLGCTIITGPSDNNIRSDIDALGPDNGIIQVDSMAAAWQAAIELLDNPAHAQAIGETARERAAANDDLLVRYTQAINKALQL